MPFYPRKKKIKGNERAGREKGKNGQDVLTSLFAFSLLLSSQWMLSLVLGVCVCVCVFQIFVKHASRRHKLCNNWTKVYRMVVSVITFGPKHNKSPICNNISSPRVIKVLSAITFGPKCNKGLICYGPLSLLR